MGLRCASCGYDNDPTRVYCHQCGTKLERGGAATPPPTGFTHPTEVLQPKRRSSGDWGRYFGMLGKLVLLAVVLAVAVLALLPAYEVPVAVEPDDGLAARYGELLRDASTARAPRAFAVPSADVNRWLVSSVKFSDPGGPMTLRPQRVYAVPGEGEVRVGLQAALPGAGQIYFEGVYAPVRTATGYRLEPRRYCLGRLPLPVFLGWPVQRQFDGLREALRVPLQQLAQASYIGVSPADVTLRWSEPVR